MDEFWDKMFICRAQEDKYEFWPLLWMIKLCAFVCITDNTDDHQIYVKFPDAEIADAHIFLGNIRTKVVCIVLTTWNSNRAILAYRECNFSSSTIRAGLSVHFDWGKSCAVLWRLMRTMQRSIYHGAHRHTNTHIRWVRAWLYGLWLIQIRKYSVFMR